MALNFPRIFLLKHRIPARERLELEAAIGAPPLVWAIREAQVVLGVVPTKERAEFELRKEKVWTEEVTRHEPVVTGATRKRKRKDASPATKHRRVRGREDVAATEIITIDSSTESEAESIVERTSHPSQTSKPTSWPNEGAKGPTLPEDVPSPVTINEEETELVRDDTIKVVKLDWYRDSVTAGRVLPITKYLVYEGRETPRPQSEPDAPKPTTIPRPGKLLLRAKADALYFDKSNVSKNWNHGHKSSEVSVTRPTHLLHQTTSEHEQASKLPPIPDFLHTRYSCQRPTPLHSPNDPFLRQLKKIKQARILNDDKNGVRAYSTAIASIAAYPYTLTSVEEIFHLPGCGDKYAAVFREWKETGRVQEVDLIDADPRMQVLNEFWNIWGVGDKGALSLYNKGYRTLDDIVEQEWNQLSRVQQIGLKYYDEFLQKIPRAEVEVIGSKILEYANKLHKGFEMVIAGGYRRGNMECGDVDVVLSHPDEKATLFFLPDLTSKLEQHGWITMNLIESVKNSERGQEPVSWKGNSEGTGLAGGGFDTLDKSYVVWQDQNWPTKEADLARNPKAKNPNVHRRVDIIISPWKTAGCAVIGWSGGTTFERDLRWYCKYEKKWKFDSSGVRNRADGRWVDVEDCPGNLLAKEKRAFERLGLIWREPTERCTG
ncbi:hypothetical protein BP6252_12781 [Coleophoma cylindrospora]|uniref:DNA polymerase n=1 Tax=Coleophoma cylindrospora TaxID=1849047 RepID=A0A3D8QE38_9HELO|nr:hypothetical protein BP6252_12781 [Coleophoma cylindrospora]